MRESRVLALPLALGTGPSTQGGAISVSNAGLREDGRGGLLPRLLGLGAFQNSPPAARAVPFCKQMAPSLLFLILLPAPLIVHDYLLWGGRVLSNVLHAPAELLALQFLLTVLHAQAHLISSCTS